MTWRARARAARRLEFYFFFIVTFSARRFYLQVSFMRPLSICYASELLREHSKRNNPLKPKLVYTIRPASFAQTHVCIIDYVDIRFGWFYWILIASVDNTACSLTKRFKFQPPLVSGVVNAIYYCITKTRRFILCLQCEKPKTNKHKRDACCSACISSKRTKAQSNERLDNNNNNNDDDGRTGRRRCDALIGNANECGAD